MKSVWDKGKRHLMSEVFTKFKRHKEFLRKQIINKQTEHKKRDMTPIVTPPNEEFMLDQAYKNTIKGD